MSKLSREEVERRKKAIFETLSKRGKKYIERIGYDKWDPFQEPTLGISKNGFAHEPSAFVAALVAVDVDEDESAGSCSFLGGLVVVSLLSSAGGVTGVVPIPDALLSLPLLTSFGRLTAVLIPEKIFGCPWASFFCVVVTRSKD